MFILTGLIGFGISFGLLHCGVYAMSIRYPIAVIGAYGGFLGLLRIWVKIEQARFNIQEFECHVAASREHRPSTSSSTNSVKAGARWLDWLDVPDINLFEGGDGCLAIILVALVAGLVVSLGFVLLNSTTLIAEVFLDSFLVSMFYRRLRRAARGHWLGTSIRRTWIPALGTAIILAYIGWVLQTLSPDAKSIGPAVHRLIYGKSDGSVG